MDDGVTNKEIEAMQSEFEVWVEGYRASGDFGTAKLLGHVSAPDFKSACILHFNEHPDFDADTLTYWGCKLFDNETDARQRFG